MQRECDSVTGIPKKPMITTPRLLIRPFTSSDAHDLHEYLSNPEVYRFEPGEPLSDEQASRLAQERANTTAFRAIELWSTGKMVGHLYFEQTDPAELRTWELGYIMNPEFQRHGYATEATIGLLRDAFERDNIHRVFAHCNPENTASWKLLEKVGFQREAELRRNIFFRTGSQGAELWTDTYEYAMLDEEAPDQLSHAWNQIQPD
jgi:RimJ/RimL family protein N-acetyltransferase